MEKLSKVQGELKVTNHLRLLLGMVLGLMLGLMLVVLQLGPRLVLLLVLHKIQMMIEFAR